ncbi:hypothetical protein ATO4_11334 [Aurantimonas sp. 22II-16-19i]|nr:hypothetical protein ATO4_11334 [Aurantimonas sp. 22II-16-19i]
MSGDEATLIVDPAMSSPLRRCRTCDLAGAAVASSCMAPTGRVSLQIEAGLPDSLARLTSTVKGLVCRFMKSRRYKMEEVANEHSRIYFGFLT